MFGLMPLVVVAVLDVHNRPDDLVKAVISEAPHMTQDNALPHVLEAIAVETDEVPAELLLSIVYSESRYNSGATSYVIDGNRKAHVPTWAWASKPPKGVSGPYFCGVSQVSAKMSWKHCLEIRKDLNLSYTKAVTIFTQWLEICRWKKDRVRCALFGYGGVSAEKQKVSTYPKRVLSRARRILNKSLTVRDHRLRGQVLGAI